ncbi:EEV membrane phosphoglycoprotein [Sea otter poxvirus]|uniref:Protein OPG161 n=1 Tax=Sea otter poxvirus TaxID=1416741 RepID=A0A2U9QHU3_9POXV|nr:EEV membrane phosphoglycoprotein [Sea otter poxvirus]AWU47168.1 EEV membrane phosphoglycoprotein [Sea otter poxvirus]
MATELITNTGDEELSFISSNATKIKSKKFMSTLTLLLRLGLITCLIILMVLVGYLAIELSECKKTSEVCLSALRIPLDASANYPTPSYTPHTITNHNTDNITSTSKQCHGIQLANGCYTLHATPTTLQNAITLCNNNNGTLPDKDTCNKNKWISPYLDGTWSNDGEVFSSDCSTIKLVTLYGNNIATIQMKRYFCVIKN